jgi:hypothetical protein
MEKEELVARRFDAVDRGSSSAHSSVTLMERLA